jgi:hypothetical protein
VFPAELPRPYAADCVSDHATRGNTARAVQVTAQCPGETPDQRWRAVGRDPGGGKGSRPTGAGTPRGEGPGQPEPHALAMRCGLGHRVA